jgi:hypothetical protein
VKLLAVVLGAAAIAGPPAQGPWVLTALPDAGTLRWSCINGTPELAMRHRVELDATGVEASEVAALSIGGHVVARRIVQPGEVWQMPWTRVERLTVTVVQKIEPRTLHGVVTVDFGDAKRFGWGCYSYLPPEVSLHVSYG